MLLSTAAHVVNPIRTATLELRRISSIRHCLSVQATKTVSAFVLTRLDYCNSLLSGCPQYLLNRLQKVHNNAARLIWKVLYLGQTILHLIFVLCTGFQSILESNTKVLLFASVL